MEPTPTDNLSAPATKRELESHYTALCMNIESLRNELRAYRDLMSDGTPIFTIGQVCKLAHCSRSTFHKYWKLHRLSMPEPKSTGGVRPLYSQSDILKLKQVLPN